MDEVLILLSSAGPLDSRRLAEREPVAADAPQVFGGQVLIARLGAADCAVIAQMAGVTGVYRNSVPANVEQPDDATGRLAVAAWNERQRVAAAGGKPRVGEGAAWDDPRFEHEGRPTTEPTTEPAPDKD